MDPASKKGRNLHRNEETLASEVPAATINGSTGKQQAEAAIILAMAPRLVNKLLRWRTRPLSILVTVVDDFLI